MIEVIYIVRHAVRMQHFLRLHTALRNLLVYRNPHIAVGILSVSVAASGSSADEPLVPSPHCHLASTETRARQNMMGFPHIPLNDIRSNG
jgi:hypothetical protein